MKIVFELKKSLSLKGPFNNRFTLCDTDYLDCLLCLIDFADQQSVIVYWNSLDAIIVSLCIRNSDSELVEFARGLRGSPRATY